MKTYSKSQLAKEYGVSYNTFKKWLKVIPEITIVASKRWLTPKDVEIIYKYLGIPN